MNEIAREFAEALKRADWEAAGTLMDEETATRCAIVPARMTVIGEKLQGFMHRIRGGVRYRWQRQRRLRVGARAAPRGRFRPLGRVAGGPVLRPHGTNPYPQRSIPLASRSNRLRRDAPPEHRHPEP